MQRIWRENSLTLVVMGVFLLLWLGQALVGWAEMNTGRMDHGGSALSFGRYLATPHFWEATTENWESEFFQMGAYVMLTVFLRQKGSAESKKLEGDEPVDGDPRDARDRPDAPGPVKQGGWRLKLYENSLFLTFLGLFLMSFVLHGVSGRREYNLEQQAHGGEPVSLVEFFGSSTFWFQSLQNWQSEFLAVGSIVWLSIYLRQRGSPESKPVAASHDQTGNS